MKRKNLYGLVVCGGKSSRMGTDKSLLQYHGIEQRYHLYQMLKPLCEKVFISIHQEQIITAEPGYDFIIDKNEYNDIGPMAAILSAFDEHENGNWLVIGCDYPFMDQKSLSDFPDTIEENKPAAFYSGDFYEPLAAYYPQEIKEKLRHQFRGGNYSLQLFLKDLNATKFFPENKMVIQNVNTPEEMNDVKKRLMQEQTCKTVRIKKIKEEITEDKDDLLTVEEPLEMTVSFNGEHGPETKIVSVTMRTPGDDEALTTGFLFTEGIIKDAAAIQRIIKNASDGNRVTAIFNDDAKPHLQNAERNFYTTSSCGVCGKSGIDAIKTVSAFNEINDEIKISAELLFSLPDKLRQQQAAFNSTGGIHASAFFNEEGELLLIAEDAGRHNALDKLIGHALLKKQLPLNTGVLLLSGRASFELVQKAMMAGIRFIAAIGAPSSLATEAAEESGITLAGFLRNGSFNLYSHHQRLVNTQEIIIT